MKGTKLYSIFTGSCPVCHSTSMYKNSNPYFIAETLSMHERCNNCKTKFKIEPSFFYGAMYVSYPVGLILAISTFVIAYWVMELSLFSSFMAIVAVMVLGLPFITRLSRNIWINFFFKFDKTKV